jgi:hypothetical protein
MAKTWRKREEMEQCITKMDNKVKQNSMVPEAFSGVL